MKKQVLFVILIVAFLGIAFWVGPITIKAVRVKNLIHKISNLRGKETQTSPESAMLEITDQEINAGLELLCVAGHVIKIEQKIGLLGGEKPSLESEESFLPCQFFKDFEIKFEEGKYLASAQLSKPVTGKVSLEGKIAMAGGRNIHTEFSNVRLDNLEASPNIAALLENTANQELNKIFGQTQTAVIESVDIRAGKIVIRGFFPVDEILCSSGAKRFCSDTSPVLPDSANSSP